MRFEHVANTVGDACMCGTCEAIRRELWEAALARGSAAPLAEPGAESDALREALIRIETIAGNFLDDREPYPYGRDSLLRIRSEARGALAATPAPAPAVEGIRAPGEREDITMHRNHDKVHNNARLAERLQDARQALAGVSPPLPGDSTNPYAALYYPLLFLAESAARVAPPEGSAP
jgi:hypothetical protein